MDRVESGAARPVTVWERPDRGARGPAALHSRTELTAVAVELADRRGLSSVSMRAVAQALGTGQASLYRYVPGREDLLDLMVDAVTGEIALDVPLGGDPVADLTALASRSKAVQLRHPWLLDVPPEPLRLGPRSLDHLEYALRALAPVRLPGGAKLEIVALLSALVAQFARTEVPGTEAPGAELSRTDSSRTDSSRAELSHTEAEGAGGTSPGAGGSARGDRRVAQAGYLSRATARGDRPHLAAAIAETSCAAPAEDPQVVFERAVRRVLTGLLTPR